MPHLPTARSRTAERGSRGRYAWVPLAVLFVCAGLVAVYFLGTPLAEEPSAPPEAPAVTSATIRAAMTSSAASGGVEVPDVVGSSLGEARLLLTAAGFAVAVNSPDATDSARIDAQSPSPGTVANSGGSVSLTAVSSAPKSAKPGKSPKWVVCIDPGHQQYSDSSPEPIGPKSRSTKPAASGGTTGVRTGIPEYELALQISMNLKRRLEEDGVTVVMTRTTNDVALSNGDRARIANKAKADLFIRIHGEGDPDARVSGVNTVYPAANTWTKPIAEPSHRAAVLVHRTLVSLTGAVDRGLLARSDQAGFNYSTVPAILVETGFMSNPVEDRLLASPHYQDKVARGIADGILDYLNETAGR